MTNHFKDIVVYEDNDILVLNKPKGLLSQGDKSGGENIYDMACEYTGCSSLGMVQRLDRPVGGLMVLAKSDEAKIKLTKAVTNREIEKTYLAVVNGEAADSASLINYIQKARGNRAIVSNKKTFLSKEAKLRYVKRDAKVVEGQCLSLLEVTLETGRFHQIRAQLAHNKLAIVGDTKYNGAYKHFRGWVDIGLYSHRLVLVHPTYRDARTFTVEPMHYPFDLFK